MLEITRHLLYICTQVKAIIIARNAPRAVFIARPLPRIVFDLTKAIRAPAFAGGFYGWTMR